MSESIASVAPLLIPPARKASSRERIYYAPLDGIRGIAIIAVFFAHYPAHRFLSEWGWAGVDLFFVLSGFLITGILYDELGSGSFFRNFYIRRSLRIFPLYFAFWILVACLIPILKLHWYNGYWAWIGYVGNLLTPYAVHNGLSPDFYTNFPYRAADGETWFVVVGHFWSLCVEEQFYLVWPFVVWFVADRRKLIKVCFGVIAGCVLCRVLVPHVVENAALLHSDFFYKLMPLHSDGLMMGSAIALWARGENGVRTIRFNWLYAAGVAAFCGVAVSVWLAPPDARAAFLAPWMQSYGLTLIAAISASIVAAALASGRVAAFLSWKPLTALGRVSYGFYILHWLPLGLWHPRILSNRWQLAYAVGCFAATWIVSWLSYRYFETPFLRLKDRLAPKQNEIVPHVAIN